MLKRSDFSSISWKKCDICTDSDGVLVLLMILYRISGDVRGAGQGLRVRTKGYMVFLGLEESCLANPTPL